MEKYIFKLKNGLEITLGTKVFFVANKINKDKNGRFYSSQKPMVYEGKIMSVRYEYETDLATKTNYPVFTFDIWAKEIKGYFDDGSDFWGWVFSKVYENDVFKTKQEAENMVKEEMQ